MAVTREKIDQALALLGLDEGRRNAILRRPRVAERFVPSSKSLRSLAAVLDKIKMATEGVWLKDGAQCTLSTTTDARNSTITGTTLAGPSGSGQFLLVTLSSARIVTFCSTTFQNLSTANTTIYGVLQNKPAGGQASDIAFAGITKIVSGSSSIVGGSVLMNSSTLAGVAVPWATGTSGRAFGEAIEASASAGAVITARLYGVGVGAT
jgi:hypothetical protein